MNLNKTEVQRIAKEMEDAVRAIAEKNNMISKLTKVSYDELTIKFGVEVAFDNAEQEKFNRLAFMYGLEPGDFGKEITDNKKIFKICGIDTKARTNCILIEDVNTGTKYKTNINFVKLALGRKINLEVVNPGE